MIRRKTFRFSVALSIFLPILAAEAQDVDVPGNLTMRDSTGPTVGNILKGGVRFLHNFGTDNTFIGKNAGNLTMSGVRNTASGSQAMSLNTTGINNTASGFAALVSNTDGDSNTATGAFTLLFNTTGRFNTATGVTALVSNTTGFENTAIGGAALYSNTTGSENTATGIAALQENTTGRSSTAVGWHALFINTTGDFNTATGFQALQSNTIGDFNTATGENALFSNTTGSFNTAIGSGTDVSMGNLTNATAIGAGAIVNASNKIRLGNEAVTVIEGLVGFTANSDRNRQENFRPVRGEEVLRKIRRLSLTSWNFIGQDPGQFRHYGPAAQDFFAAFGNDGIGTIGTPTTITSTDIDGILMVAVQALERRTEDQDEQIDALKARLEALERMVGNEVAGR